MSIFEILLLFMIIICLAWLRVNVRQVDVERADLLAKLAASSSTLGCTVLFA